MGSARHFFVVVALALLGFGGGLQPATGAEGAYCTVTWVIVIDPGLSMEPSTGTHRSDGVTALHCDGSVNGHRVTGPGRFSQDGPYGTDDPDTCQSGGEATGIDRLTIPTADGPQQIDSEFKAVFGKLSNQGGLFHGEFSGTRFSGTFEFRVLEGDCVTTPITRAEVISKGIIHD